MRHPALAVFLVLSCLLTVSCVAAASKEAPNFFARYEDLKTRAIPIITAVRHIRRDGHGTDPKPLIALFKEARALSIEIRTFIFGEDWLRADEPLKGKTQDMPQVMSVLDRQRLLAMLHAASALSRILEVEIDYESSTTSKTGLLLELGKKYEEAWTLADAASHLPR